MDITEQARALVAQGLRNKKQTRAWLAEKVGRDASWTTRFFAGEIKSISDEQALQIQKALGIRFFSMPRQGEEGVLSPAAISIAQSYDEHQGFASIAETLRDALDNVVFTPRFVPPKEMSKLGRELIAIVEKHKEKPGKVARLVLELLA